MAIISFFKGIFPQTAILTAVSLPLGFSLMHEPGAYNAQISEALLWPIHVCIYFNAMVVNPLNYPLGDYWVMSAFAQFVGFYLMLFLVHMTIRGRWTMRPRTEDTGAPTWKRPGRGE